MRCASPASKRVLMADLIEDSVLKPSAHVLELLPDLVDPVVAPDATSARFTGLINLIPNASAQFKTSFTIRTPRLHEPLYLSRLKAILSG